MTHLGELGEASPTGKRVTISGITIDRFEDGKIVEAWRSMDTLPRVAIAMRDLPRRPRAAGRRL